jgi:hypothetical protein
MSDQRATACMPDLVAAARVHPDLRPAVERLLAEKSADVLEVVERARARGEVPADTDASFVRDLLFGPTMFRMVQGRPPELEVMEQVTHVVVAGLRALAGTGGDGAGHPDDRHRG